MAEALAHSRIRAACREGADVVRVSSAGTRACDGAAMDPRARAALRSLGVRAPVPFTARSLSPAVMDTADLVLTAERRHRAAVVARHPGCHGRVFTVLEFVRVLRSLDRARCSGKHSGPGALVREAARTRGLCPPPAPGEDDIADPFTGSAADFERCAAILADAVDWLVPLMLAQRRQVTAVPAAGPQVVGRPAP